METTADPAERPNIFVSYSSNWRAKDVHKVMNALGADFNVWPDLETTNEDYFNEDATEQIQSAYLVVCFFSNDYKASTNCMAEAECAKGQSKPILVVRLDPNVKMGLKFGLTFGTHDYLTLDSEADNQTYLFDTFMQELVSTIRKILDKDQMDIANSPEFHNKFVARPTLSPRLLERLEYICKDRKAGLLFLSGPEKCGKTHFLLDALTRKSNQLCFLGEVTRFAIWLNCKKWAESDTFEKEVESRLIAFAKQKYPETNSLTDVIDHKVLLIFDDVGSIALLQFVSRLSAKLPCVVIASDFATQMMQMDPKFLDLVPDDTRLEIDLLSDQQIITILRSYTNAGTDKLAKMASQSKGSPGVAVSLVTGSAEIYKLAEKEKRGLSNYNPIAHLLHKQNRLTSQPERAQLLRCIQVPQLEKYYPRPDDEHAVLEGILETAKEPTKGVFLVHGGGGNGKSTLVASVLQNPSFSEYFQQLCGIQVCIWVNCYRWKTGLRSEETVGELEHNKAEINSEDYPCDLSQSWQQVFHMQQHFSSTGLNVLFILDDCFHPSVLDVFRKKFPSSPCCVITRYESSVKGKAPFASKHLVAHLAEEKVVEMFETTFDLKDKLTPVQLGEMARRCRGSPLVAGLIGGMFPACCRNYRREYEKLRSREFGRLLGWKSMASNMKPEEKTAHLLFRQTMFDLDVEDREMYFAFLLYDPVTFLRPKDLAFLWSLSFDKALEIIQALKEKALVTETKTENSEVYTVHQILHEAAVDFAKERLGLLASSSVNDVRMAVLYRLAQPLGGKVFDSINAFLRFMDSAVSNDFGYLFLAILRQFQIGYFERFAWTSIIKTENSEPPEKPVLYLAIHHGDLALVKFADAYDDIDIRENWWYDEVWCGTPVHAAARSGNVQIIEYLSERYPKAVSMTDPKGNTPLQVAAESKNFQAAHYLSALCPGVVPIQGGNDRTPLHVAAQVGNTQAVKHLSKLGPEAILIEDRKGRTPLHLAAESKHFEAVEYLSKVCPEAVSREDRAGRTPLHLVALSGNLEVIKHLAGLCPEAVSKIDKRGHTPFHNAAESGNLEAILFLSRLFPESLSMKVKAGFTPLHRAAKSGSVEVIQYLSEQWPESVSMKSRYSCTPLLHAAFGNNTEAIRYLAQLFPAGSSMKDNNGRTPLHEAVKAGSYDIMQFLSKLNPEAVSARDALGKSPLHMALESKDFQALQCLANLCPEAVLVEDANDRTVLHVAVESNDLEAVQCLSEICPEAVVVNDGKGQNPFHKAAASGNVEALNHLAQIYPEVISMEDKAGRTPFHLAAASGNVAAMKFLIDSCPEVVSKKDKNGFTPLHGAARSGNVAAIQYLYSLYPEAVSMKTSSNFTPLFLAVKSGNIEAVRYLRRLCKEAVSMEDENGRTLLHEAAKSRNEEIIEYLSKHYPEAVPMKDAFGYTALHLAAKSENFHAVQYLSKPCPEEVPMKDNGGDTVLHFVASSRNSGAAETIKSLTALCPELVSIEDSDGYLALDRAIKAKNMEAVQYMCEQFPETLPTKNCGAGLLLAISKRQIDMIKCLAEHCAEELLMGMLEAVQEGANLEVMKCISEICPEAVSAKGLVGRTPLHFLVEKGESFHKQIKFLVDVDPDGLSIQDERGRCPLHLAVKSKYDGGITYLSELRPATIAMKDNAGRTPLHLAAESVNFKAIRHMTKLCPEAVSMTDKEGRTALHEAVASNHFRTIKYLAQLSPESVLLKDEDGRTPLDEAKEAGNVDVIDYLSELSSEADSTPFMVPQDQS